MIPSPPKLHGARTARLRRNTASVGMVYGMQMQVRRGQSVSDVGAQVMTFRLSITTHFLTIDVADWTSDPDVAEIVARRNFDPLDGRAGDTVNSLLDRLAATSS